MHFHSLLTACLPLWPNVIDLSDGHHTPLGGFYSKGLLRAYSEAEHQAQSLGEWPELMTWVLYQQLHRLAKQAFTAQLYQLERDALLQQLEAVRIALLANLQMSGYENMLADYLSANQGPQ